MNSKPKYRVLHIIAERYPTHGSFLAEVLAWEDAEYAPVFLVADAGTDKSQEGWPGIQVYTFPEKPRFRLVKWINTYFFIDLRHLYLIPKIVFHHKINIIQVRDITFPLLWALIFKLLFRTKVLYQKSHPHEYKKISDAKNNVQKQVFPRLFYLSRIVENKMLHWAMRYCDAVLPITSFMADNLHNDYQLDYARMEPFGLGLVFSKLSEKAIRSLPLVGELRLIYVGTLAAERQFDILLKGVKQFSIEHPDIKFHFEFVGGTKPEIRGLQQVATKNGVNQFCSFTGRVDRKNVYLKIVEAHIGISWIGAHKRFADASPTKAIEYLCLGIPVLATDTVLEHAKLAKETGAVVLARLSPDSFSESLYSMYKKYGDFSEHAVVAREYMYKDYSYEIMRDRLMSLYQKITK